MCVCVCVCVWGGGGGGGGGGHHKDFRDNCQNNRCSIILRCTNLECSLGNIINSAVIGSDDATSLPSIHNLIFPDPIQGPGNETW